MIIFFGLAGSGKSIQSDKLSEAIGWKHVSAGAMLREYDDPQVQADLKAGRLVDYNITNRLMRHALDQAQNQLILDGYPRQLEQAQWIIDEKRKIELCILLEVSVETIKERLALRGRSDDSEEAIQNRITIFNHQTQEVLEAFEKIGAKIVKIDGHGPVDEVHKKILAEVKHVLATI